MGLTWVKEISENSAIPDFTTSQSGEQESSSSSSSYSSSSSTTNPVQVSSAIGASPAPNFNENELKVQQKLLKQQQGKKAVVSPSDETIKVMASSDKLFEQLKKLGLKSDEATIKFVVIDNAGNSYGSIVKSCCQYILPYNVTHIALQVNTCLIDWCANSLVYPREVNSTNVVVALDLQTIPSKDIRFKQLCDLMEEWNTKYDYDRLRRNCQSFVEEAMKILKLSLDQNVNNVIGAFFKALKKGNFEKELRDSPDNSTPTVKFDTHADVDRHIIELVSQKYPGMDTKRAVNEWKKSEPELYTMLKGFDRAFWVVSISASKEMAKLKGDDPAVQEKRKVLQKKAEVGKPLLSETGNNECPLFPFSTHTQLVRDDELSF